jgi:hypothetical protein
MREGLVKGTELKRGKLPGWFFAAALLLPISAEPCRAQAVLTSWLTNYAGVYARVYTNTSRRTNGNSNKTWVGQTNAVYAGITEVSYNSTAVYVRCSGMPSYVMGPWLTPQGGVGQLWPSNQSNIVRIARTPQIKGGTKTSVPAGLSGIYVDGMACFNPLDGKAWTGTALAMSQHFSTDYFWHANAPINESYNFDYGMGHQPPNGVHHTHQNPLGLRYQVGDHVDYNTTNKVYSESTNAVTAHSPILGWSLDGYPVYGPYGYSNPTNPASGVRRMVSGYVLRDGTDGADHVTNNLFTIPAWYARFRQDLGAPYTTNADDARHSVGSGTNHGLGFYAQDWAYQGDMGRTQGVTTNFDLDVYNGRTCVTPDFTNQTYAYFVTIDETNSPTYPYVFAFQYYGVKSGASGATVPPNVTTNFTGGANVAQEFAAPAVVSSNSTVTLVWRASEGGQYVVETSPDLKNWSVLSNGINATLNVAYASSVVTTQEFYRVTRTNLAVYEP